MRDWRWWWFAAALWAWALGGPVGIIVLVNTWPSRNAMVPCPLCGSGTVTCAHRAWAQAAFHAAGTLAILWFWSRRNPDDESPERPVVDSWSSRLAVFQTLLMLGALVLEAVHTESVLVTGPALVVAAGALASPIGSLPSRLAGLSGLVTALGGFYMVALFGLSPGEAHVPLFVLGSIGTVASALGALVAVLSRGPEP